MHFSFGSLLTFAALTTLSTHKLVMEQQKKVVFTLYFESLCPYCKKFITRKLIPTWNDLGPYMEIELVPYGNAGRKFVDGHWNIYCQHGPRECEIHVMEACAIEMLQDSDTPRLLEFLSCFTKSSRKMSVLNITQVCGDMINIPVSEFMFCDAFSEEVMVRFAEKTELIKPIFKGVPGFGINGVYNSSKAMQDFIHLHPKEAICKFLEDPKPDVCKTI